MWRNLNCIIFLNLIYFYHIGSFFFSLIISFDLSLSFLNCVKFLSGLYVFTKYFPHMRDVMQGQFLSGVIISFSISFTGFLTKAKKSICLTTSI